MATIWKNLNSVDTKFATWDNDAEKPSEMPDGSKIPINNFGLNVKTLEPWYWDGTQWIKCD